MPIKLSFELLDKELQRWTQVTARNLLQRDSLMHNIASYQLASTKKNFYTESFNGERWQELAPTTANRVVTKAGHRRGYNNILHPTGRHLLGKLGTSADSNEARVWCAQPWAWVHQYGTKWMGGHIPRRQFLGATDNDREKWQDIASRWMKKAVK